jgi:dTDP-4-dehydrorhamnose reductase
MKVLITGGRGQLGVELARSFQPFATVHSFDLPDLDISSASSVTFAIEKFQPTFIINAAAYTAVDKAEQEPSIAHAVNAEGPRILASAAAQYGAGLVHYSTDYVFDGRKPSPYVESDPTAPLSEYGRSKVAGENAVLASDAAHLVLRSSWICGTHGKNFLLTMLRLGSEREELAVVDDQFGAPTWSRALADATRDILLKAKSPDGLRPISGLYHLTAAGQTSWCRFANAIFEEARRLTAQPPWMQQATSGLALKVREVRAITTAEYPLPAKRPSWSVLSNAKIQQRLGIRLPDWREQLHAVLTSDD